MGWNTESTLLPKKAKKIAAPATSMGALKDEVFASSMTAAAAGSREKTAGGGRYARGTASRRRKDADDLDSAGRKRPRRRETRTGEEVAADARDDASRRKLEAKARLYEDLRRGEVQAPPEFLVEFDAGAASPPARVAEQESGGTRWAWGRGEGEAPPARSAEELLDVAARRAAADRAREARAGRDDAPRSDTAVKSQWEKTLNKSEKAHLGEIHAEAERERAAAPQRQAQRDARVAGLARLVGRLEQDT